MTRNPQAEQIVESLIKEVKKFTNEGEKGSYLVDPVFGIVRNRVNAEVAKTYFRLNVADQGIRLMKYVLSDQAKDGSWNEIHPNYRQKSALVTAFIGDGGRRRPRAPRRDPAVRRRERPRLPRSPRRT